MNFFNLSADPYSLSQAMQGQPTYQQQVSRQAGQIVSAIGSKLPGTAGQVAQRVGQAVSAVGNAQPTPRYGPVTQLVTPSGQYHTRQGFSMERGGKVGRVVPTLEPQYMEQGGFVKIGGGAGSIAPWYRKEKGGKIKKYVKKV